MSLKSLNFRQCLRIPNVYVVTGKSMSSDNFVILSRANQIANLRSCLLFSHELISLYIEYSNALVSLAASCHDHISFGIRPVQSFDSCIMSFSKQRNLHFQTVNKKLVIISTTCKIISRGIKLKSANLLFMIREIRNMFSLSYIK